MAALNQGRYLPLARVIGTWGGGLFNIPTVEKRSLWFDYVDSSDSWQ